MIGLSSVGRLGLQPLRPLSGRINPASWYAGGAPGVAYDLTDLSTLYQDRGASSPVTAVGQSVGVAMDLARGPNAVGSQLLSNGGGPFVNTAGWSTINNPTFVVSAGEAILTNTAAMFGFAETSCPTIVGRTYIVSFTGRRIAAGSNLNIQVSSVSGGSEFAQGVVSSTEETTVSFIFVAQSSTSFIRALLSDVSGASVAISRISVRLLLSNPLIAPTDARRAVVGTSANGLPMLSFDGTRAYATAATLDLTSTDEVTVVAAVRGLAAASIVIVEFSSDSNNFQGVFLLAADFAASSWYWRTRGGGTLQQNVNINGPVYSFPNTAVLLARAKIATPISTLSRNGVQIASSNATQMGGNYGNHTLNVGARNAASPLLLFNGDISRLAIIGGPISQATLDQMQAWARAGNNAY